jgi:hypothetical protein
LIFESDDDVYAVEIKNKLRPSNRDVSTVVAFARGMKKKIKMYLFYPGDEHIMINDVNVMPVAGLFRRQ